MNAFETRYVQAFQSVGRPLSEADALAASDIQSAEHRLGLRVPAALRAFYLLAGRATDFNCHYDRFLAPHEWTVDAGKLCFLEENQAVVIYAACMDDAREADPPVFMSHRGPPFDWHQVSGSASQFIAAMLCWEAAFGGAMPHTGTAPAPPDLQARVDADWCFVGEVNGMQAWSQPGRVICHLAWSDGLRLFLGATTAADLQALEAGLGLSCDTERP